MTVYVDELRRWHLQGQRVPRCFERGSCHMTADTVEELHAMARRLRLRRAWFQDHPLHPHYDLTGGKRKLALEMGAVFVPAKEQARQRLRARGFKIGAPS